MSGPDKTIADGFRVLDPTNSGNMLGVLASLKITKIDATHTDDITVALLKDEIKRRAEATAIHIQEVCAFAHLCCA